MAVNEKRKNHTTPTQLEDAERWYQFGEPDQVEPSDQGPQSWAEEQLYGRPNQSWDTTADAFGLGTCYPVYNDSASSTADDFKSHEEAGFGDVHERSGEENALVSDEEVLTKRLRDMLKLMKAFNKSMSKLDSEVFSPALQELALKTSRTAIKVADNLARCHDGCRGLAGEKRDALGKDTGASTDTRSWTEASSASSLEFGLDDHVESGEKGEEMDPGSE